MFSILTTLISSLNNFREKLDIRHSNAQNDLNNFRNLLLEPKLKLYRFQVKDSNSTFCLFSGMAVSTPMGDGVVDKLEETGKVVIKLKYGYLYSNLIHVVQWVRSNTTFSIFQQLLDCLGGFSFSIAAAHKLDSTSMSAPEGDCKNKLSNSTQSQSVSGFTTDARIQFLKSLKNNKLNKDLKFFIDHAPLAFAPSGDSALPFSPTLFANIYLCKKLPQICFQTLSQMEMSESIMICLLLGFSINSLIGMT